MHTTLCLVGLIYREALDDVRGLCAGLCLGLTLARIAYKASSIERSPTLQGAGGRCGSSQAHVAAHERGHDGGGGEQAAMLCMAAHHQKIKLIFM